MTSDEPEAPAQMLPTVWHLYVSTSCSHGLHARCRLYCKFCHTPCLCTCHDD